MHDWSHPLSRCYMIPRIIHQIWTNANDTPPPAIIAELCDTWRENHPGCEHRMWNRISLEQFIAEHHPQALPLLQGYPYDIQRIDVLKYFILHHYGGVYVDVDVENIKSVFKLFREHDCYLSYDDDTTSIIGNCFIACQPGSTFMAWVLSQLETAASSTAAESDKMNTVLRSTGPIFMTQSYHAFADKDRVKVLPCRHVSPLVASESR